MEKSTWDASWTREAKETVRGERSSRAKVGERTPPICLVGVSFLRSVPFICWPCCPIPILHLISPSSNPNFLTVSTLLALTLLCVVLYPPSLLYPCLFPCVRRTQLTTIFTSQACTRAKAYSTARTRMHPKPIISNRRLYTSIVYWFHHTK